MYFLLLYFFDKSTCAFLFLILNGFFVVLFIFFLGNFFLFLYIIQIAFIMHRCFQFCFDARWDLNIRNKLLEILINVCKYECYVSVCVCVYVNGYACLPVRRSVSGSNLSMCRMRIALLTLLLLLSFSFLYLLVSYCNCCCCSCCYFSSS